MKVTGEQLKPTERQVSMGPSSMMYVQPEFWKEECRLKTIKFGKNYKVKFLGGKHAKRDKLKAETTIETTNP